MCMTHFIYKLTNKINGKIYIGQAKDVAQRWRAHKAAAKYKKPTQIVHHAIIKYGLDNFIFEVIFGCKNQDDINWAEEYFIQYYDSLNNGYNLTNGGSVAPKTDEWKKKISQIKMGHEVTKETREKLSKSHTGKKLSDNTKNKLSKILKGKIKSKEHIKHLSQSLKGNQNCLGKQNSLGYKHTEEAKEKIGAAVKGKSTVYKGKTWKIVDGKRVWVDKQE